MPKGVCRPSSRKMDESAAGDPMPIWQTQSGCQRHGKPEEAYLSGHDTLGRHNPRPYNTKAIACPTDRAIGIADRANNGPAANEAEN
ncbi:hypothetical protein M514_21908 [Trichuris suis]|uniref:Uncharacterized protein n=1 Tax=Trichuris suis TaxID=68888 RepID=A0A085N8Z9_9BILA|nr:hypothetical protein M513_03898 [Trichuris suis]KFD55259.1 hypothetical protein M513_03900 [Trichuris suis]KFD65945.1 hypothetical protein M514_21908 [Trichuris suis]